MAIIVGIEDDIDQLVLLQTHVTTAGHIFFGATNGGEGLTLVRQVRPELVILDVTMPGIDGFETCRRLRADPELPRMPILLLTGRKSEADVLKAKEVGANDFVIKPFAAAQLAARLKRWTNH